jgi:nicotinamidase-related amidase
VAEREDLLTLAQRWRADAAALSWPGIEARAATTGVVAVDMLMGFARVGPLASPRVDALVEPLRAFLEGLAACGVRSSWRLEDEHTPDAGEFAVYPPHCLKGTVEAEPVPELLTASLFRDGRRVPKNALTVFDRYDLEAAVHEAGLTRVFVVGDCTDLCVEACAVPLRLYANARRHELEVTVIEDLVDTFDAPGHPGDQSHALALYRMAQNGIRVARAPEAAAPRPA